MKATKKISLTSTLLVSGLFLSGCGWLGGLMDDTETETPDNGEEVPAEDNGTEDPDTDTDTDPDEDTDADLDEDTDDEDEEVDVEQDITVWFPMLEDTLLDYEGEGNEFAPFTAYPQFVKDDTLQMVESTGGTDMVTIY